MNAMVKRSAFQIALATLALTLLCIAIPHTAYADQNLTAGTVDLSTGKSVAAKSSGSVSDATLTYTTHIQNVGWENTWKNSGQTSGTSGRSLRLEAIKISVNNFGVSGSIMYQTHVQNIGWQDAVKDGAVSGTSGKSLRLEGIRIWLTGDLAKHYDICYRTHVQNVGWQGWVKNGAIAGTTGQSLRLEAIQIVLTPKTEIAAGKSADAVGVRYTTHVQNDGWKTWVGDGAVGGTTGRSLRVEALQILASPGKYSGGITYRSHIQNIGWQEWVKDGAVSGTSGESLRCEAIEIKLTGELAKNYDVYYQAHVENFGWLDWAKNGESAGSSGLSLRCEAYRIKLVKKGDAAPGPTKHPMVSRADFVEAQMSTSVRNSFSGISLDGAKAIGIDVSVWNGDIDWNKVAASGIRFAIIRCGYGSDYTSQDDAKFYKNVQGARAAGLDIGVYLYSYATNTSMASSEADHTLRLLKSAGLSPRDLKYGVYYDIEEKSQMSISLEPLCRTYCNKIQNAGYTAGIYSSLSWWNSYLTSSSFNNWKRWIAQWPYKTGNKTCSYTGNYVLWQCMSDGSVPGIVGNVDMDIAY